MNAKFLRLTAELNALDYFEKVVSFIRETEKSDIAWKWVVLSLHGAIYGFAISACRGTNSDSVLNKKGQRHLISFNEAIKQCESGRAGNALIISSEERKCIDVLKKVLRNNFEHYRPRFWSIELHGFPTMTLNCIRVVETLATETSRWVKLDKIQRRRVKELADEARILLLSSKLYLDLQSAPSQTILASVLEQTNLTT